jgi:predicted nuclease of predicted toxin-antitoxin system
VGQVRYFLDEHIHRAVTEALRRRGVEVLTAQEAGRTGFSDLDQIEFCRKEGIAIVTMDSNYLAHAAKGVPHAGIVKLSASRRSIREIVRKLLLIRAVLSSEEMEGHVEFV